MKRNLIVAMAMVFTFWGCSRSVIAVDIVDIPAGTFVMGGVGGIVMVDGRLDERRDEAPAHEVSVSAFRISACEITNAQYETFRPEHKALRGKDGVSFGDNEAVVNVSWFDAMAFCEWLSRKTGRHYRLPTEAEWEYACRAGSITEYFTGDTLPPEYYKNQEIVRDYAPVSLEVGRTPPNAFGLYDMHGNVEEWCLDWYGLYPDEQDSGPNDCAGSEVEPPSTAVLAKERQAEPSDCTKSVAESTSTHPWREKPVSNPCGPDSGEFRVTRGGSHNTPVEFLRSSNRMAMLPADKHSLTGFRIVESDISGRGKMTFCQDTGEARPRPYTESIRPWQNDKASGRGKSGGKDKNRSTSDLTASWEHSPSRRHATNRFAGKTSRTDELIAANKAAPSSEPLFAEPIPYVVPPSDGTPFYSHNHQPSIACCDNGDLLAIWFSANAENGREMLVLGSRLRAGADAWDPATLFYKVPDRNMTGSSLLNDGEGRLLHFNGVEAAGDWQNLAMIMRISEDNGYSWSAASLIAAEHTKRHQVIPGTIKTREGYLIQLCDAGAGGNDGAAFHISRDGGKTWTDPAPTHELPEFVSGGSGHTIAGIHAGIVQLDDGSFMTLGRGNSIAAGQAEKGRSLEPNPTSGGTALDDGLGKMLAGEITSADDRGDNSANDNPTDIVLRMPMSRSTDWGVTWTYAPSEFPPIGGGQRLVLLRLHEGPILLISFTDTGDGEGMEFTDKDGNKYVGHGMFAALSYDEGATWPVRKLFTDGLDRELDGGAWTGAFHADATHAEPKGYLAATQSPDGTIHVLSSRLHYRINLPWLED